MSTDTMKIEFTNLDLLSKEGWTTFLNERKDRARELSRKKDPGFVDTMLVLTRHPETGQPPAKGSYMLAHYFTAFHSDTDSDDEVEAQKDGFAMTLRSVAIVGNAIASVWRSEAWVSTRTAPREGEIPQFNCQPRHDPNRKEVISMMADHRDFGTCGFAALITPHASKPWKRVIGEWSMAGDLVKGRFASFLPAPGEADDPMMVWAARTYLKKGAHLEKLWENEPNTRPAQ